MLSSKLAVPALLAALGAGATGSLSSGSCERARAERSTADIDRAASTDSAAHRRAFPNEPEGFVRIADRRFSSPDEDGWRAVSVKRFSIVEDSDAPFSPPGVGRALYPRGFRGGKEPIVLTRRWSERPRAIYVSFWFKMSPNFHGHPKSGVNKILHIWIAGKNRVYLSAQGSGSGALRPQVRLQQVVAPEKFLNLKPDLVPSSRIERGRWHRWELLLRANTGAGTDGSAEWWLDGRKVGSHDGIAYVARDEEHGWQSLQWAPTWGGMGFEVAVEQSMYMDHLYVSAGE